MKIFSTSVLATLTALSIGVSGCISESMPATDEKPEYTHGEPTKMSLTLNLGSATVTRAGGDANATDDEVLVKELSLFIYDGNGTLEKDYEIPRDQLSADAGGNKFTTKPLETSTGSKTIYVGLNMTGAMKQVMKANSVNTLDRAVVTGTLEELTNKQDGFAMFSIVGKTADFQVTAKDEEIPQANKVEVQVQRLAAKIAVGYQKPYEVYGEETGTLKDLVFVVDNINKKFYLPNNLSDPKDPNMKAEDYNAADFFTISDYDNLQEMQSVIEGNKENWNTAYSSENIVGDKKIKGMTRVVVKGAFVPSQYMTKETGTWGNKANTGNDPETFILLDIPGEGKVFFKEGTDDDVLKAYLKEEIGIADNELQGKLDQYRKTYQDGMNYWWVTMPEGSVIRNNFYQVAIRSIMVPGRPKGEFTEEDKDKEITEDTNIEVTVNIEPWNEVPFDTDLKP